ncbi:P63C domain-containing protein [Pseudomonas gorinensis]
MTEPTGKAKGGVARAKSLTPEERSEIAQKAAKTRWDAKYKATHTGELHLGDLVLPCAVLPDGSRVLSQRGVGRALGKTYGGMDFKSADEEPGGKLPFFLAAKTLSPFISGELLAVVTEPIIYHQNGAVAHGISATALPQICEVWLKAREAGALTKPQLPIAARAEIIIRGLAHVGITALVDEATGYQEVRDKQALQAILDQYLRKELAAWAKRFPDEFYNQMFRLKGWQRKDLSSPSRRPGAAGMYTNDIVYERLAPGILQELEVRNPKDSKGNRKGKHHQMLTEDVGHPALAQHVHALIALMRASSSWEQFMLMLNTAFPKKNDTLLLDLQPVKD